MEESDVVAGVCKHFVEWGADEFAAADEGDFGAIELDIIAGKEPVDGGGGGGIEFGVLPKAIDILFGSDKITEFVGSLFVSYG